jgi:hypothetical protein
MYQNPNNNSQIQYVSNHKEFINSRFEGKINATCLNRDLKGDFFEIIRNFELNETITILTIDDISKLQLTPQGCVAREVILTDFKLLENHGASPTLNIIKNYDRDDSYPFFPTDVYSFHVDRSPIPTATYLCTYYGAPSEIIPNSNAKQKILIPEIRKELKKLHDGSEDEFDSFLSEYYFDLHYEANSDPISLGLGNLWCLAVDHPESKVLPCIHRAPKEKNGQPRLLLIC